jgi:hypothetical protein
MPRWRVTPKIRRTSRRRLSSESVIIINVSSSDFTSGLVDPVAVERERGSGST